MILFTATTSNVFRKLISVFYRLIQIDLPATTKKIQFWYQTRKLRMFYAKKKNMNETTFVYPVYLIFLFSTPPTNFGTIFSVEWMMIRFVISYTISSSVFPYTKWYNSLWLYSFCTSYVGYSVHVYIWSSKHRCFQSKKRKEILL